MEHIGASCNDWSDSSGFAYLSSLANCVAAAHQRQRPKALRHSMRASFRIDTACWACVVAAAFDG